MDMRSFSWNKKTEKLVRFLRQRGSNLSRLYLSDGPRVEEKNTHLIEIKKPKPIFEMLYLQRENETFWERPAKLNHLNPEDSDKENISPQMCKASHCLKP